MENDSFAYLIYSNLLLLGMDPRTFQDHHGVSLSKDLHAVLGKKKTLIPILHFIFDRMDPADSRVAFKACWPILDKSQERDFFRVVQTRLVELERSKILAVGSSRRSLLDSCGGEKFTELLLVLSSHSLRCAILREYPRRFPTPDSIQAIPISAEHAADTNIPIPILHTRLKSAARRFATNVSAEKTLREKRARKLNALRNTLRDLTNTADAMQQSSPGAMVQSESSCVDERMAAVRTSMDSILRFTHATKGKRAEVDLTLNETHENRRITIDREVLGEYPDVGSLIQWRAKTLDALRSALPKDGVDRTTLDALSQALKVHQGSVEALQEMNARMTALRANIEASVAKCLRRIDLQQDQQLYDFLPTDVRGCKFFVSHEDATGNDTRTATLETAVHWPIKPQPVDTSVSGDPASTAGSRPDLTGTDGHRVDAADEEQRRASIVSLDSEPTDNTSSTGASSAADRKLCDSVEICRALPSLSHSVRWASETSLVEVSTEVRNVLETRSSEAVLSPPPSTRDRLVTPRRRLFLTPQTSARSRRTSRPSSGTPSEPSLTSSTLRGGSHAGLSPFDVNNSLQLLDDISIGFPEDDQTLGLSLTPLEAYSPN